MSIFSILGLAVFVYAAVNEYHTLKASKAAGANVKTLAGEALQWIKSLFTSSNPPAA